MIYSGKIAAFAAIRKSEREERQHSKGITLAGGKITKQVFNAAKRKSVINRTMDVLRDWRMSPFENEAMAVHGIRTALCLQGHGWQQSNTEAFGVVADSLRLLGVSRPTWDQGQKEYAEPRENCVWCFGPNPPEMLHGNHSKRFCSDVCARSFIQHRDFEGLRRDDASYRSAFDVIARSRNSSRPCKQCGEPFQPKAEAGTSKGNAAEFCSPVCASRSRITIPARPCGQCKKVFKPKEAGARFCSLECAGLGRRKDIPERGCIECGTKFRPRQVASDQKFCSRECRDHHGHGYVKDIPERTCTGCGNSFRPNRVTSEQKFCSRLCRDVHGVTSAYERNCMWCGGHFIAKLPFARCCTTTCSGALSAARRGRLPKRINGNVLDFVLREHGATITYEMRIAA